MKLYVVPTPIGNLKDITYRAVETLNLVKFIACEDTRRTTILLNHYQIKDKTLLSYYEPKESLQIKKIITLLKKGEEVALVSDAGTPSISDPGYRLIRACIEENIPVEVLPGPSALITALVGSGLPTDKFCFVGFSPKKSKSSFIDELLEHKNTTLVVYESPQRILDTLMGIYAKNVNCDVVVARELTKIHEEFIRGTIEEVLERLKSYKEIKGEIVLLLYFKEEDDGKR